MSLRVHDDVQQPRRTYWASSLLPEGHPAQAALSRSGHAAIVQHTEPPHRIAAVNRAWASLCGFHPDELVGSAPKLGNSADPTAAARFVELALGPAGSSCTSVVNHTKDGRLFLQHLQTRKVGDGESAFLVTESYGESNSIAHAPLPGFLAKLLRHESASERLLRDKKAGRTVGVPAHRRIPAHAVARRAAATRVGLCPSLLRLQRRLH